MNPDPNASLTHASKATADVRGRELLARWAADLAGPGGPDPPALRALRRVALTGKTTRANPIADRVTDRTTVALALSQLDPVEWRERLDRITNADPGAAVALIEELDNLELVWATAERAGLAPAGLRAELDACVERLVDVVGGLPGTADYAELVCATLHADLPRADPLLALTAEKFAALLDAAEAERAEDAPLPPLRLPPRTTPPAAPAPRGRIPELRGEFTFKAGTAPPELAPVPPFEWRSPDGHRTAILAVPRSAPPDRTLALVIEPAADLVGEPVLLGGLRGVVASGGVVKFDWDEVRAVEPMLAHLIVDGGGPWVYGSAPEGGKR